MRFIKRAFSTVFMIVCILSLSIGQSAMPGVGTDKDWNFSLTPYFWFSGLNGSLAAGPIDADIDASVGDIFENLSMAFMFAGEIRYKKIGIAFDFLTLSMGIEGSRPVTELPVKVSPKMTYLETSFMYSMVHNEKWSADAYMGIRTWWATNKLETEQIGPQEDLLVENDRSWIDPLLGAKATFLPHEKWPLSAKVDIGGFGAGSDFTWNAQLGAGYRFAKSWTVLLQYRALGLNYSAGESESLKYFEADLTFNGALIGVMATF